MDLFLDLRDLVLTISLRQTVVCGEIKQKSELEYTNID